MSHLGDSGKNHTPAPTMTDENSWPQMGTRNADALSHFEQPKMVQLAAMEPSHLKGCQIEAKTRPDHLDFSIVHLPHAIVQPGMSPSPNRVRYLANVSRSAHGGKAHSETKYETATHKHAQFSRRCLDTCSKDNKDSADEHPHPPAQVVIGRPGEGYSRDRADVVEGKDESSL
jgi:hypothetical protein